MLPSGVGAVRNLCPEPISVHDSVDGFCTPNLTRLVQFARVSTTDRTLKCNCPLVVGRCDLRLRRRDGSRSRNQSQILECLVKRMTGSPPHSHHRHRTLMDV